MKAILRFNLDDPDDQLAHLRCVHAIDMAIAIDDVLEMIRKIDAVTDADLERIRERLHDFSEMTR